jgi:hypothetical protein
MGSGWLRPTRAIVIATAAFAISGVVAAPGAVAAEPFGPTVKFTNNLPHRSDRFTRVDVDVAGFGPVHNRRPVAAKRFLRVGESFSFDGEQLEGLEVSIKRSDGEFSKTQFFFMVFFGTARHHDLTVTGIENRHVPEGVRIHRETTRCWQPSVGSYPC